MKLFKVTVEVEFFVQAEDDDQAYMSAKYSLRDAVADNDDIFPHVSEVTDLSEVPKEWRDSYAYGDGNESLTCEQLLTNTGAGRG